MQNKNHNSTEEIHIFDFLKLVWKSKGLIIFSVIFTLSISYYFVALQDDKYESKLNYEIYLDPPFYQEDKIYKDFKKIFFSKESFDDWDRDNKNNISFDVLTGGKPEINFLSTKKNNYISIASNDQQFLDYLYDYSNHVNDALTDQYASRARLEIKMIKSLYRSFGVPGSNNYNQILTLDRYISAVDDGSKTLTIKFPTPAVSGKTKPIIIYLISIIFGLVIGIAFIFVREEINKYRMS